MQQKDRCYLAAKRGDRLLEPDDPVHHPHVPDLGRLRLVLHEDGLERRMTSAKLRNEGVGDVPERRDPRGLDRVEDGVARPREADGGVVVAHDEGVRAVERLLIHLHPQAGGRVVVLGAPELLVNGKGHVHPLDELVRQDDVLLPVEQVRLPQLCRKPCERLASRLVHDQNEGKLICEAGACHVCFFVEISVRTLFKTPAATKTEKPAKTTE